MRMGKKPQVVEIDYVQRMLASLLWLPSGERWAGQAVQLGLGAGAITRFTAVQLKMATTVVEINPQVVAVNVAYFACPHEAEVVQGDAADWLDQANRPACGCCTWTCTTTKPPRRCWTTWTSTAPAAAVLKKGGVMSVNLFGRHASFHDSIARIAGLSAADQVWSLRPTREGNTVVVAGPGRGGAAA
jgi:spermidine synthase